MRRIHAAGSLAAALASSLLAGGATAQTPPGPGADYHGRNRVQTMVLQKQQLGSSAFGTLARTRMRNGDCAGALDVFDAAVLHSADITMRRDRGLCHEQLGHPYPAMEDYRAYLASQPDAPDAEGIRQRLARLEADSPVGPTRPVADDDAPPPATASATVSAGGSTRSSTDDDVPPPDKIDRMDYVEHDNDVLRTPLRRGKGFSFGPFYAQHKWFFQGSSFGEPDTWAECVGLQLRYSFGHTLTGVLEGAYEQFNSTTAQSADTAVPTISGLSSQLGLEVRIPFDAEYVNQLLLMPGLGFESLTFSYSGGLASLNFGALVPRARVGWRHMLTTSVAFDLSLDLGVAKFVAYSDFPLSGNAPETALLGLNAGLNWGI